MKWPASYAILGPYGHVDLFEAPDEETVARVIMTVRSYGSVRTETWTAVPWERFESLISAVLVGTSATNREEEHPRPKTRNVRALGTGRRR